MFLVFGIAGQGHLSLLGRVIGMCGIGWYVYDWYKGNWRGRV